MSEMQSIALSYPKLVSFLRKKPDETSRAKEIFKEIHGDFNPSLIKHSIKLIDSTFGKLYDGINLDVPDDLDLKDLTENAHVILVPNHQSHADYIALTYVLYGVYEIPVYIAGGINLNIFPLGSFFRRTGAFFIRRSFHDDQLYKHCFEAYIFYLLKKNRTIEFFFEGGRSRSGKLMSPRFGLFQMLLEAAESLDDSKELLFVPVTLAHEHLPEEGAHAKELGGAKKRKESAGQLLKLWRLWERRLGTIHVRLSHPIAAPKSGDIKGRVQELAFSCFRAVGKGMPLTPSSLLAFILLNEPAGAMTWEQIRRDASEILDYCRSFKLPLSHSLSSEDWDDSLARALDLFEENGKIKQIERRKLGLTFFAIEGPARVQLLYSKNMILHHFLVPVLMNMTWFNVFSGRIQDQQALLEYLTMRRKELKFEFYLPSLKELVRQALRISSHVLNKTVQNLDEVFELPSSQLFQIAHSVRLFSTAFTSIYETYYLCSLTAKYLRGEDFDGDRFVQVAKELFDLEIQHGRMIRYPESFTVPKVKDGLRYLQEERIVGTSADRFNVIASEDDVQKQIEKFAAQIGDQMAVNLKLKEKLDVGPTPVDPTRPA